MEQSLPAVLPVFPLTGVLLLPGMRLPLHIFEPRYRNMVADALAGSPHIGMVQPVVPREDNRPLPGAEPEAPELYTVGCAGVIEQHEQAPDGRYAVVLKGISRFRALRELPLLAGYRRVEADYAPFAGDLLEESHTLAVQPLLSALAAFAEQNRLSLDMESLRNQSAAALVNGLSMSLPFGATEKQALLESPGLTERVAVLRSLLAMVPRQQAFVDDTAPPIVN